MECYIILRLEKIITSVDPLLAQKNRQKWWETAFAQDNVAGTIAMVYPCTRVPVPCNTPYYRRMPAAFWRNG
jgi:hypothetical protein